MDSAFLLDLNEQSAQHVHPEGGPTTTSNRAGRAEPDLSTASRRRLGANVEPLHSLAETNDGIIALMTCTWTREGLAQTQNQAVEYMTKKYQDEIGSK